MGVLGEKKIGGELEKEDETRKNLARTERKKKRKKERNIHIYIHIYYSYHTILYICQYGHR